MNPLSILGVLTPQVTQAVTRWTVFVVGIAVSGSFIIMLILLPKELDTGLRRLSRIHRINAIFQAGLGVHMAAGAWLQHPLGWYAALAVTVLNPLEAIIRHRWILSGDRSAIRGAVVVQTFLLLLLALLLTRHGRAAFGIGK